MFLSEIKTDIVVEKQILTAFIVSDEILHQFSNITKPEYFESTYIGDIIKWTLEYYQKHEKSPKTYIQSIFDYKVADGKVDEAKSKLIEQLLTELSVQFEVQNEVNVNYYADIIEEHFKRRELEITVNVVKNLIADKRVSEAEFALVGYSKIARTREDFVNPFDEEEIRKTFEESNQDFFRFPGQLGDFLGDFDRGWLIGLAGPFKRGKTWYAQEFAVQAMLSFRKVLFFSLEMSEKQMNERLYKRLTVTGDEAKVYRFPIFDCKHNQTGTCLRPERTNRETLYEDEGGWNDLPPTFTVNSTYQACSVCRHDRVLDQFYFPAMWYEARRRPEYDERRIALKLRQLKMYFPYIRYKCYPRFSANVGDMRRDVQMLEWLYDFIPDVIVVDYADILRPEEGASEGFEKEDRTWIALSQLAMERNCLVVTPTQVTKAGQDAAQIGVKHQARWVGKMGHVDAMFALNQTEKEQNKGLMRFSTIAHRHNKFSPSHNCLVLQNLDLGQPHLDSEIQRFEERDEDEDELD
jgi:hypothetical protein